MKVRKYNKKRVEEAYTKAWMLRYDGEEFECDIHNVIFAPKDAPEYLLLAGRFNRSIEWYYNYTTSSQVKNDIALFFKCLKAQGGNLSNISIDFSGVKPTEKDSPYFDNDINKLYEGIFIEYCNEFIKARLGGLYTGDGDSICYFRIASLYKNWYNVIWKFLMTHKSINVITVCSDEEVTGKFSYKKLNGKEIKEMSSDEFIKEKGNPVVEKYRTVRESYGVGHINRVTEDFYYKLIGKDGI